MIIANFRYGYEQMALLSLCFKHYEEIKTGFDASRIDVPHLLLAPVLCEVNVPLIIQYNICI